MASVKIIFVYVIRNLKTVRDTFEIKLKNYCKTGERKQKD